MPNECFISQIKTAFPPGKDVRGEAPPATAAGG
jgi:hypothetical protein